VEWGCDFHILIKIEAPKTERIRSFAWKKWLVVEEFNFCRCRRKKDE
jgi:hypothetical protein